jgi:hypothetical protein
MIVIAKIFNSGPSPIVENALILDEHNVLFIECRWIIVTLLDHTRIGPSTVCYPRTGPFSHDVPWTGSHGRTLFVVTGTTTDEASGLR